MVFQSFWSLGCFLPRQPHRQNGGGHRLWLKWTWALGALHHPVPPAGSRRRRSKRGPNHRWSTGVSGAFPALHTQQRRQQESLQSTDSPMTALMPPCTTTPKRCSQWPSSQRGCALPDTSSDDADFSFKTVSDSEAEVWKRRSQLRGLNTGRGTRRYIFRSISGSSPAKQVC